MTHSNCPNCKLPVIDGSSVTDYLGQRHMFHPNCMNDVLTGWSGGPCWQESGESFDQMMRRVNQENFSKVGINLYGG